MKKIFTANHPIEAHLLKGLLEAAGMRADVQGDLLYPLRGEISLAPDSLPTVWIADDADEAEALRIVKEFEAKQKSSQADAGEWRCPACGEMNPGTFTACWKCVAGEGKMTEPVDKGSTSSVFGSRLFFRACVVSALVGGLGGWLTRDTWRGSERDQYSFDRNGDGKSDEWWYYAHGKVERAEQDMNFDGKVDWRTHYLDGTPYQDEDDGDFDGKNDVWREYKNGRIARSKSDHNGDGVVDVDIRYENGRAVGGYGYQISTRDRPYLKYSYQDGYLVEIQIDSDLDGLFDRRQMYDRYGVLINERRIPGWPR